MKKIDRVLLEMQRERDYLRRSGFASVEPWIWVVCVVLGLVLMAWVWV